MADQKAFANVIAEGTRKKIARSGGPKRWSPPTTGDETISTESEMGRPLPVDVAQIHG